MADDNLQVKVDAKRRNYLSKCGDSGQTKKDFMASIIAQYQCYSLQKGTDLGIPELNSLEQHAKNLKFTLH